MCKYWANIAQILGIYWPNIGQLFGKYWANIGQILGIYWANIEHDHDHTWLYNTEQT